MIVLGERSDGPTKMPYTERNDSVQALGLDGEHEAFRKGYVGTLFAS